MFGPRSTGPLSVIYASQVEMQFLGKMSVDAEISNASFVYVFCYSNVSQVSVDVRYAVLRCISITAADNKQFV